MRLNVTVIKVNFKVKQSYLLVMLDWRLEHFFASLMPLGKEKRGLGMFSFVSQKLVESIKILEKKLIPINIKYLKKIH